MNRRQALIGGYLAWLIAANLSLLLPPASPLRIAGAFLLIGFWPGLSGANRWFKDAPLLLRLTLAAAISTATATLGALLLHYLPGPIPLWPVLTGLNALALLPLWRSPAWPAIPRRPAVGLLSLLLILLPALLLRTANLSYSEFQGDEALAMLSAAEALEGHEDALFLRAKGPAEVLLPLALWRLAGAITEPAARLPFTAASLWGIITIYLIGVQVGGTRLGWLSAGIFALNGFMVAFGRIVQYQALVVWFSALAFLLTLHWRRTGQWRYLIAAGGSVGLGLLAHYDAVLVLPALGWLLLGGPDHRPSLRHSFKAGALLTAAALLTALPFYLPFLLDPQAGRTGDYVGGRIGTTLRNNLPDFFHFNTFYSSGYYLIITGLLVLAGLVWLAGKAGPRWRWLALGLTAAALTVMVNPTLLVFDRLNLAVLPFALLLLVSFGAAAQVSAPTAALVAWLAVPFLGYNFVVALGLTHIYTIVPAWSLLAAAAWVHLVEAAARPRLPGAVNGLLAGLALLFTLFLWHAFVQHDVPYRQNYPQHNLSLFWTPYNAPPQAGFFGFPHRAGWKAVGQKIATGELSGDYGSNEEPDVTAWYTRSAPRACDPHPEFYFLAADLVDPVDTPAEVIAADYQLIGTVDRPRLAQMQILQLKPAGPALGQLDEAALARAFDRSATPDAFARSAEQGVPVSANFGGLVQLVGYTLDTRRAYPGGRVPVTLYWQALTPIPAGYHVFVHLESVHGPAAQADGVPVCWTYPTDRWRPGQIIADPHALALPPDIPPGPYPLEVGLFVPDTFTRLDVLDVAGNPAGVSLPLSTVEIRN